MQIISSRMLPTCFCKPLTASCSQTLKADLSPVFGLTASAEPRWKDLGGTAQLKMTVMTFLWIWDLKFAFTLTTKKILCVSWYLSPTSYWKIFNRNAKVLNFRTSHGAWLSCIRPLHPSCMCVAVRTAKRVLEKYKTDDWIGKRKVSEHSCTRRSLILFLFMSEIHLDNLFFNGNLGTVEWQ